MAERLALLSRLTWACCETISLEVDLTRPIRAYFASDLYGNLEARHSQIREFADDRNSSTKGEEILDGVYRRALAK
jgi:hypothetical protein